MSEEAGDPPKLRVRKRLEYIDFRLYWDGRFNRSELAETFGMSTQQASADIATYQDFAPGNLAYDGALKAYVRTPGFQPKLVGDSADRHLLQLVAMASGWMDQAETWFQSKPPVEVVALQRPPTNSAHLMGVLDAIRLHQQISVDYRSMTGSPPSWRKIAPHAMAYNAGRWYVRAWAREHNDFRDYLLSRIRGVDDAESCDVDFSLDYEWHHNIELIVVPNPRLNPDQRHAVIEEFQMSDDGRLAIPTRLSLSFYLIAENNLDLPPDTFEKAERQRLVLENLEEVAAARRLARAMSTQALGRRVQGGG